MECKNFSNLGQPAIETRFAIPSDLPNVIDLDSQITTIKKIDYWEDTFGRFVGKKGRYFLVAENRNGGETQTGTSSL